MELLDNHLQQLFVAKFFIFFCLGLVGCFHIRGMKYSAVAVVGKWSILFFSLVVFIQKGVIFLASCIGSTLGLLSYTVGVFS